MSIEYAKGLGEIIRRQRVSVPLTLQELARIARVSPSYIGRIERGERFPSARILNKIAGPLGFDQDELFSLAGYLAPQADTGADPAPKKGCGQLDPYVARMLAQEPPEVQRAVIGILAILKLVAKPSATT